jgi:DNA-binding response OmpR family regulator
LGSFGYEVDAVADGRAAVDSVAAGAPDVVVLDWHLPDMDGIQTCQLLRALSDAPIIMVSGNRSNSKSLALGAGASEYLRKPFSVADLLTLIESALKSPRSVDRAIRKFI